LDAAVAEVVRFADAAPVLRQEKKTLRCGVL
jgi:hypothetical protein